MAAALRVAAAFGACGKRRALTDSTRGAARDNPSHPTLDNSSHSACDNRRCDSGTHGVETYDAVALAVRAETSTRAASRSSLQRWLIALRGLKALRYAGLFLVLVEFADEFASGVPYATAFAVQSTLGVGGAALNAWTFFVPQLFALVVEPYLMLRAERWGTTRALQLGLSGMAAALLLGAVAPSAEVLGVAVALYFPSSGVACGVAQIALMDGSDRRSESLTDWTLAGTLGDLGTPVLLWALDAAGFSWRWTFGVVGLLLLVLPLVVPRRFGAELDATDATAETNETDGANANDSDDVELSFRQALRLLTSNRTLLWWLLAAAACSLLDELFASQIGIHLAHTLGQAESTEPIALQLIAMGVGGAVGLVVQRALLRRYSGPTILAYTSVGTLVVFGVWLLTLPSPPSLMLALVLGATIATHYPLTQAQAYDALPGRANVVAAASQALTGIDLVYPVLVGALSDTFSPGVGVCALLVQPLSIVVTLAVTRRNTH